MCLLIVISGLQKYRRSGSLLHTMIDTVQVVLLIVIILLTALLIAVGVQVFFILKDLRKTVKRANRILENTETITTNVSEPISFLTGLLFSTKSLDIIKKILGHKKKKDE